MGRTMINAPGTIIHGCLDHDELDMLEQLIDRTSLTVVLDGIAQICSEKGEPIHVHWQDHALGEVWDNAAGAVLNAGYYASKHHI